MGSSTLHSILPQVKTNKLSPALARMSLVLSDDDGKDQQQRNREPQPYFHSTTSSKIPHLKETLIKLNVGGQRFTTYAFTLCKSPYFQALFSGNFGDKPNEDETYFIDRSVIILGICSISCGVAMCKYRPRLPRRYA